MKALSENEELLRDTYRDRNIDLMTHEQALQMYKKICARFQQITTKIESMVRQGAISEARKQLTIKALQYRYMDSIYCQTGRDEDNVYASIALHKLDSHPEILALKRGTTSEVAGDLQ